MTAFAKELMTRIFVLAVMLCLFVVIFIIAVAAVLRTVVFHKHIFTTSGAAS